MVKETSLKVAIRKAWGGWSDTYEPGFGAGQGIPDLQLLNKTKHLVPIEVKLCSMHNGRVWPHHIRAAQVGWHERFRREGGRSFIVAGWKPGPRKKWKAWAITNAQTALIEGWRDGWPLEECTLAMEEGSLHHDFTCLIETLKA